MELTRIYSQPKVFDFSEEFERASQYQANKDKPGYVFISSIDPATTLSPVDTGVRIDKNMIQEEASNSAIYSPSESPRAYMDAIKEILKNKPFDAKDMDSPEFHKRMQELWEAGPQPPQKPGAFDGPSSEF